MRDEFEKYIDSLGRIDDSDLYMDIDETMEIREADKAAKMETLKSYTSFVKPKNYFR